MKSVFIIDPGLLEEGGHHAALFETLLGSNLKGGSYTIFCHEDVSSNFRKLADHYSNVKLRPHFKNYFYEHYDNNHFVKVAGIQKYIRSLAIEYYSAFRFAVAGCDSKELVFFYPCLNYEHALALQLALSKFRHQQSSIHHKVCCMFSPSAESSLAMNLYYRMGFKALSSHHAVQLYATDSEIKQFYESIGITLDGIHPCYLLPWKELPRNLNSKNCTDSVLLYLGDAKENKGFFEIENIAKSLLSEREEAIKIVVQFTMAWETPELLSEKKKLKALSEKYTNLQVFDEFWSTDRLVNELSKMDMIICTYDTAYYQNKSSGLAWLASYFNIPIIMKERCWIQRESERLGNNIIIDKKLKNINSNIQKDTENNAYRDIIFDDFIVWLQS